MISSVQSGGSANAPQPMSFASGAGSVSNTGQSSGTGDVLSSQAGGGGSGASAITQEIEQLVLAVVADLIKTLANQASQSANGSGQANNSGDSSSAGQTPQADQTGQANDPNNGGSAQQGGQSDNMAAVLYQIIKEFEKLLAEMSGQSSDQSGGQSGGGGGGGGGAVSGAGNAGSGNAIQGGNNNSISGGSNNTIGGGDNNSINGSNNSVNSGSSTLPSGSTGNASLAQNQKTVKDALDKAGATKQQEATIMAMGEQETQNMNSSERDTSKDGTSAQNYSAFNLNPAALKLMGLSPSSSLNDQSNIGKVAVGILHGFQNSGESNVMNAVRGGSAALADGTSYGAADYRASIAASTQSILSNNALDNGVRIAANLGHV